MARSVRFLLLILAAACGGPTAPELGRLTGSWAGGCCPGFFDFGTTWSMYLAEDSSGKVSGTVTQAEVRGPSTHPEVTEGTVMGDHDGTDVVLYFRYTTGRRGVFRGQQISETVMEGSMSGWRGHVVGFSR